MRWLLCLSHYQRRGINFAVVLSHRYPLEFCLDSMVHLGLEAMELWAAAPHFCIQDPTPAAVKRIRRQTTSRGLKLVCFTPEQRIYPVNLGAKEAALRRLSVAYFAESRCR